MKNTRLAGHELPDEGRVYEHGIHPVRAGRTRCTCGQESPVLPSANARRNWHRGHKNDIRSERGLAASEVQP